MATQTIIFAARRTPTAVHVRNLVGGTETAGSTITALDDGLYSAEFSALSGDFTLHLLDGSAVMGVGAVWDVTNTAATFYEQDLVQPSSGGSTPTPAEIADEIETRELKVGELTDAALLQFVQDNTGETAAVDGSVAQLAQGAAGSGLTEEFSDAALQQMRTAVRGVVVRMRGPVTQDEESQLSITLVIGDDYLAEDGRQIEFELQDVPTLTDAEITLRLRPTKTADAILITGTPTVATGDTKTIRFEPTSDETAELSVTTKPGEVGEFEVHITDAGGHEITPLELRGVLVCLNPLA